MGLSVTYKRSSTKDGLYAYALRAEARISNPEDSSESELPDPAVFVFRRSVPAMNPFGPTDKLVDDEFFNVATPVDMFDVPAGEPDIESGMPYFRDSKLDLWFRNFEDLERAQNEISSDIASLVKSWDNVNGDSFEYEETISYNP